MRLVDVKHINENYKLALSLYNTQGQVLLRGGAQLNSKTIHHIKNLGYQSIYITDRISTDTMDDYMDPKLRFDSLNKIEEAFKAYLDQTVEQLNNPVAVKWYYKQCR